MKKRPQIGSRFRTDALITIFGSGGGQFVNVAAIPILARLYTPGEFGIWATYLAVLAVLTTAISLRFDIAIVTARTDRLASEMLFVASLISMGLVAIIALLISVTIFFFGHDTWVAGQKDWIVWTPIGVLGTAFYTLGTSWWLRMRAFRSVMIARIAQALFCVLFQLALFWISARRGLVVGSAVGQVVVGLLIYGFISPFLEWPSWGRFRFRAVAAIKRFRGLAFYTTPYSLQGQVFRQLPILLFSSLASTQVAGLFGIAQRFAYNPLAVIATAFQQPIYPRLAAAPNDSGVRNLIAAILQKFGILLGTGCAIVTVFARPAIIFALGAKWADGAPYLVATCYATASLVSTSWLVRIFDIFGRQRLHLIFDFTGNMVVLALFAITLLVTHNGVWAVIVLSAGTALYYAAWAVLAFHVAGIRQQILVNTLQRACLAWAATMILCLALSYVTGLGILGI